jgi:uncharacterized protein YdbL (DUF1318 family)
MQALAHVPLRSASFKLLVGTALFLSLAVASTLASAVPTSPISTQAPGYLRVVEQDYEVTALFDGYNDLSPGQQLNLDQSRIRALLADSYGRYRRPNSVPVIH